ncbi:O-antigen ligase family protein [Qipengyuania sp. CAU 1752]
MSGGPVPGYFDLSSLPKPTGAVAGWMWTCAFVLILLMGGANPSYPATRHFAELLACIMLGVAIASRRSHLRSLAGLDWLALTLIGVLLLQMAPLPPALWQLLPHYDGVENLDTMLFGAATWRSWSIDWHATFESMLFLIPALAVYAAVRSGDDRRIAAFRRGLTSVLAIAIGLSLLQSLAGDTFYPFDRADTDWATGFFTNHNHQATFLLMAVLLMLANSPALAAKKSETEFTRGVVHLSLAALAIICVLLTGSRAGTVLLALAVFGAALVLLRERLGLERRTLALALGGVVVVLAALVILPFISDGVLSAISNRSAIADDKRFVIWPQALAVAGQSLPFGSGFGTFREVYEQFEPLDLMGQLYINHAHNDFLELVIEGGLVAAGLVGTFFLLLGRRIRTVLRARTSVVPTMLILLAMSLPIVHSLVDYPLRTITISTLVAYALGLIVNGSTARNPMVHSVASTGRDG